MLSFPDGLPYRVTFFTCRQLTLDYYTEILCLWIVGKSCSMEKWDLPNMYILGVHDMSPKLTPLLKSNLRASEWNPLRAKGL